MRECSPHVTCHVSHFTCHMSCVTCHMSHVTFHISHAHFFGGACRWMVCYQRGLPRLVSSILSKLFYSSQIADSFSFQYAKRSFKQLDLSVCRSMYFTDPCCSQSILIDSNYNVCGCDCRQFIQVSTIILHYGIIIYPSLTNNKSLRYYYFQKHIWVCPRTC